MSQKKKEKYQVLGIERKPRKTTSSKWHATQNTRRGHRKGKQTALRQRGGQVLHRDIDSGRKWSLRAASVCETNTVHNQSPIALPWTGQSLA